jgi:hypothetical protein
MLEDRGRLILRMSGIDRTKIVRAFIYIPIYVARDSQFPFHCNQNVMVRIEKEGLSVRKVV